MALFDQGGEMMIEPWANYPGGYEEWIKRSQQPLQLGGGLPQIGQANPQDPWGSSGNPLQAYEAEKQRIQALNRTVGENQSYDDPTDPRNVMINGQSMFRLGDGSGLPVSADYLKQLQGGATYDPVHGYVVDPNLAAAAQLNSYTGGKGGDFNPFNIQNNWNQPNEWRKEWLDDDSGLFRKFAITAATMGAGAAGAAYGAGTEGLGSGLTEGALASESGFLPGSFELGVGGAEGLGGAEAVAGGGLAGGLNPNTGGAMFEDFFPDVLDWNAIDAGEAVAPWTTDPSLQDLGGNVGGGNWYDSLLNKGKSLFGGGKNPLGGGGGGSNFNPFSLAAGLAAVQYARNQDPFDTSRLENAYNQVTPAGLTGQFDINTGLGRNQLTSDLSRRGVSGSSFANADMANFDMARDVGRQNLLTGGATAQANIGNQILQAQIAQQKNKNDLYGRALLALSGVGAPPNPFANLMGG